MDQPTISFYIEPTEHVKRSHIIEKYSGSLHSKCNLLKETSVDLMDSPHQDTPECDRMDQVHNQQDDIIRDKVSEAIERISNRIHTENESPFWKSLQDIKKNPKVHGKLNYDRLWMYF